MLMWHCGDLDLTTMQCTFLEWLIDDLSCVEGGQRHLVSVQGRPTVLGFWEAIGKLDRSVCWSVRFFSIDRTDGMLGDFSPCKQSYTELGAPPECVSIWEGPKDQKKAARKMSVAKAGDPPLSRRLRLLL